MKKILIIIFIILIGSVLFFVLEPDKKNNFADYNNNELVTITLSYPDWLENLPNKDLIKTGIESEINYLKAEAKSLKEEFPDTSLLPFSIEVTFEKEAFEDYESVLITKYQYSGGAHGNYSYETYNYKSGEIIRLSDYIKETSYQNDNGFLEIVNNRLTEDGVFEDEFFQPYTLGDRDIEEVFPHWRVFSSDTGKRIKIIFPAYELGSFAEGSRSYDF